MRRPANMGIMGGPKVGKTHFAVTAFESGRVDPHKIIYFDNHGSTDAFPLHQWTVQERWGVKHISPDSPEELYKEVLDLRNTYFKHKRYPYELIVVDDWSEFAQADIEDRLSDEDEKKTMRHWGKHGEVMRSAARLLHPGVTHAHHIAIFQAAQLPDPLIKRPKKIVDGHPVYTEDTRDTALRPFLQGSFGAWFPYKLDAVWYQKMEVKVGKYVFSLQLVPTTEVAVLSRWLDHWVADPKRSKTMEDPSFDKVLGLIEQLEKDEEEQS